MTLRGHIESFGLVDVLNLIASGQRSGSIVFSRPEEELRATIDRGWIVAIEDPLRATSSRLGARLVRADLITQERLGEALKRRSETDEDMGLVLIAMGSTTEDDVRRHATLEAIDRIFELFTWERGTWEFEEGAREVVSAWAEPIRVDYVLLNGSEFLDRWPEVQRLIPSYALVVMRRSALPAEFDGTGDLLRFDGNARDGEHEAEPTRAVHKLCQPGRTVRDVLDRAPFPRFETMQRLAILVRAGAIALGRPPGG